MTVHGMNHSGYALMLDEAGMTIDTGDDEAKRVKEERRSISVPKSRHAKSNGEEGWDLLWIAVNESGLSKSQKAWNSKVRLSRNEFLEVLVRGAIMGKAPDDMPRCVGELVQDMLNLGRQPHASLILHDANAFRRTYCYLKEVCAVLKHHNKTLRNLYDVYAEVGTGAVDVHGSSKLLSIAEWVALVRDLGMLKELTMRKVIIAFSLSRMVTIDESARKNQIGTLTQISFEGFLEAIVRLTLLKAMPTDKEMRRHGFEYPGEFFGSLMEMGPAVYQSWLTKARLKQQRGLTDPIWRRLDMFVLLIICIVQFGVAKCKNGAKVLLRGHPDEEISYEEAYYFFRKPTPYVFETNTGA